MKRALRFAVVFSILMLLLIAGAGYLTNKTKQDETAKATTVPDAVEFTTPSVISSDKMYKRVLKSLNKKSAYIYTNKYQSAVDKILANWKSKGNYTIDSPLLVVNAYGTNKTGLYIYFKHDYKGTVEYTVSLSATGNDGTAVSSGAAVSGTAVASGSSVAAGDRDTFARDFTGELYSNPTNMALTEHEGQIIGLVPGRKNYVTVRLFDETGTQIAKAGYRVTLPADKTISKRMLESVYDRPIGQLSDGLYCVLHNDDNKHILFYDNSGVVRADIPLLASLKAEDVNVRTFDDKLFYPINGKYYVAVNHLGKMTDLYNLGDDLTSSGDFDLSATAQLVVGIGSYKGGKTKNDIITGVDLFDRSTEVLVDMRDLMSDYYKKNVKTGTKKKPADWLGLNSVCFVNDTDIIVSAGKLSSIIRIDNVKTKPTMRYILGPSTRYAGTKQGDKVYEMDGNFLAAAGQNDVRFDQYVQGGSTKYYLNMFNNNYTKNGNEKSYFYKYMVDEDNKKYSLVMSLPVNYSGTNGSAEENKDNYVLITSDNNNVFSEYNAQLNRLAKFTLAEGESAYRVIKLDMKGVWFAGD